MEFKQSVSFVLSGLLTIASIANTTSAIAQGSNFFPSFFELCNRLQSLPPDQKYTIEILLREAKTENCQTASNYLTNLQELSLVNNQIVDLTPLANLTNLEVLLLSDNKIKDITPLANFTNLRTLSLMDNQIVDVSPLANLNNLEVLFLSDNKIKDLTPIYKLGLHVDLLGGIIINISPEGVPAIDGGYSCECDRSSCVCDRLQPTTPTQPIPELKKNSY